MPLLGSLLASQEQMMHCCALAHLNQSWLVCIRLSYYLASLYNMKLLFEQRLNGLQLILALGHARHSLGQTKIHKKHLRLGLAAIWHNHNVLVVQIVDQNLAAMHLPQGLLSVWQ